MASAPAAVVFQNAPQNTTCTVPTDNLCHYITDAELEKLSEMRKEPVMEMCLASSGVFFGAVVPALQEAATPSAMNGWSLAIFGLAAGSLFVSLATGYLWWQRAKAHKSLAETIRSRPRISVTP
ncbi:hypothetical protein [Altererythrobacter sp. C41]|uniref:hypothetical protein n=1 Tax=Altererythrobacter sp. C41 TaxID=2806021 RepID=UPI001934797B|nr:hypothetical protein [Altererythrobacter sp. C41]MBM0169664.1 hypothetical protein [Altererythrobacter sp. C41]